MRAYKAVMWDGQEYSVPVEMKWLTVDSDGEVNVWVIKPIRADTPTGFWMKTAPMSKMVTIETTARGRFNWKETLTSI